MNEKTSDTNDNESKTRVVEFYPENPVMKELRKTPETKRDRFLTSLSLMARNLNPTCTVSPLGGLGKGVYELKQNGSPAWRCIYYTDVPGKIVVVHVTDKSTEGPDRQIANMVKERLKALKDELKANRNK